MNRTYTDIKNELARLGIDLTFDADMAEFRVRHKDEPLDKTFYTTDFKVAYEKAIDIAVNKDKANNI